MSVRVRVRVWAALAILVATTATCIFYTGQPRNDPRVVGGKGVTGRYYFDDVHFVTAELLWGDSAGYLVLTPGDSGRVTYVHRDSIQEIWLPVPGLVQVKPTTPAQLDALRGSGRFPFGITDQVVRDLLSSRNQSAVDTLSRGRRAGSGSFLDAARNGTARYRSVDAAVADGFKPVGTEFPFMGEHWVNLPRVLENRFDSAQPSVLIYVNTPKGRALAGVGYTALLAAGEKPPVSEAPEAAWHEHNGSVADESLPELHLGHEGGRKNERDDERNIGRESGLRLAVMHAWVWIANPDGAFVTDNRALPFVKAGAPARAMSVAALRGLTLAQDSAGYYLQTLRTSLRAGDVESAALERGIGAARAMPAATDDERVAAWDALWTAMDRELPARRHDLARVRAILEGRAQGDAAGH